MQLELFTLENEKFFYWQFFYKVEKYKEKLIRKYKPKKDDWYTYFIISAKTEYKFRKDKA
jgi:hypothetical protein